MHRDGTKASKNTNISPAIMQRLKVLVKIPDNKRLIKEYDTG